MRSSTDRLDSWKEIAAHFGRTVRTVQRWERACGMPVRRHQHLQSSTVYASRAELEAWWRHRAPDAIADEQRRGSERRRLATGPAGISPQELCRLAREEWDTRTADGLRRSLALAEQASARDPLFGQAHAMQALAHVVLASHVMQPAAAPMEAGRQAALRALEVDEALSDAHTALGLVYLGYDWSWTEAERAFGRAIELNPADATAWSWLGFWHLARGNADAAIEVTRRAEQIDPASLIIRTQVGWVLYFLRRYEEALDQLETTLAHEPGYWRAYLNAAFCYIAMGRHDDAVHSLEMAMALNDFPVQPLVLVQALAQSNRTDQARQVLDEALGSGRYLSSYFLAQSSLAVGESTHAGRVLEQACEDREWLLIFMRVDPAMDVFRDHSAYGAVLERVAFDC